MAFQVPPSAARKGEDSFEFSVGDATFRVRKAKYTNVDTLVSVAADDREALEFFAGSTKAQRSAVHGLDREQFAALMKAWYADSELAEGESQASSS